MKLRIAVLLAFIANVADVRAQTTSMVPVQLDGETVKLKVVAYRPAAPGPVPTLIFHHGSTGRGTDPALFSGVFIPQRLVEFFTHRGWAVVLPSRRGRGGSEGRYDEGFAPDRSRGYTCERTLSLAGADRALRDVDAATKAILAMPFVDRTRVVVGGQSRGGILSVAYAGQNPGALRGVINVVGGWMSARCGNDINPTLFKRGAAYPSSMLWLYGENDPYYPLSHSQANFAAFTAAGGKGEFLRYPPPAGLDGHGILFGQPAPWTWDVDRYLRARGLPTGS